jgi:hypothetical protein
MEFLVIGCAVAFNFLVIKVKFEKKRFADGVLDVLLLAIITFLFSGSFGGLVVATVASAIISLFLLAFPPKLPSFKPPSLSK